jgi:hypothetical protein
MGPNTLKKYIKIKSLVPAWNGTALLRLSYFSSSGKKNIK